jgi:hypothetical protein
MNVWDVFWFLFVFVPLTILWVITLFDLFGRRDLVGWQKALWAMVIIFFPWIGVFAYLVSRPREAPFPAFSNPAPSSAQAYTPQSAPTPGPSQFTSDARTATS